MKICGRCGGVNTTDVQCPECGAPPGSRNRKPIAQDLALLAPKLDYVRVPKSYLGTTWNAEIFWTSHHGRKANKLVNLWVSQMEKVHNIFMTGGIPDRSVIFAAPAGYGKMVWAYSCIQFALTNGYSVAPLLDTAEIKRMMILSSEKPSQTAWKRDRKDAVQSLIIDYEEYIEADVLFLTVSKLEQRRGAATIIAELLDKRARRGKGIICLSRYSVAEISQWDGQSMYSSWTEPIDPVDSFKLPSIVSCL